MLKTRLPLHAAPLDIAMCTAVHTIFHKSAHSAQSAQSAQKCETSTVVHFCKTCVLLCTMCTMCTLCTVVHIKTKLALQCTHVNIVFFSAQSAYCAQKCTYIYNMHLCALLTIWGFSVHKVHSVHKSAHSAQCAPECYEIRDGGIL